jgi:hypothetical protein
VIFPLNSLLETLSAIAIREATMASCSVKVIYPLEIIIRDVSDERCSSNFDQQYGENKSFAIR